MTRQNIVHPSLNVLINYKEMVRAADKLAAIKDTIPLYTVNEQQAIDSTINLLIKCANNIGIAKLFKKYNGSINDLFLYGNISYDVLINSMYPIIQVYDDIVPIVRSIQKITGYNEMYHLYGQHPRPYTTSICNIIYTMDVNLNDKMKEISYMYIIEEAHT